MRKYNFISIDNILSKFHRDMRGIDINESDAIEWVGESLDFMKINTLQEESLAFLEVSNFEVEMPKYLHYIVQIAKDTYFNENYNKSCISEVTENLVVDTDCPTVTDCQGNILGDYEVAYYRPYYDLQYEYFGWYNSSYYRDRFVPVRLSNHSFFNSLVCKETYQNDLYSNYEDYEYTISGSKIRFSFEKGRVAISYLRQKIDDATGYPMIPDSSYAKTAINYYLIWKFKERECWNHREGACQLAEKAQLNWNSYIKKFKNNAKMPFGIDQYQNLMEQSNYLIPRTKRYYGFFGRLGKMEDRKFNDPNYRNIYPGYGRKY